jgi:Holliday junction resolvase
MRTKAKVDNNQAQMVKLLRNIGASVAITSSIGNGFPDLVIGYKGKNYLVEVKSAKGKLTPDQLVFAAQWRGDFAVVRDLEDLALVLDLAPDYFIKWGMKTI